MEMFARKLVGTMALGLAAGTAVAVIARRRSPRMLLVPATAPHTLAPDAPFPHADFTAVTSVVVDDRGWVDYKALRIHPAALYRFVAWVEAYSPATSLSHFPTQADHLAYWLNAYNALVMLAVLEAYPVRSILTVPPAGGAFTALYVAAGGVLMTLEAMHERIRGTFRDPRVHFALCSATRGGPGLRREAYHPALLGEQLDTQAHAFIRNPAHVWVDVRRRTLVLSPLLRWYTDDFLHWMREMRPGEPETLASFLRPYLPEVARELLAEGRMALRWGHFDWRLNDAASAQARAA